MADNVTVSNNSGSTPGDYTVETDDIGSGVESQIVGLRWGAKDATVRVSAAAPLPVVQTGTPALPTGAATEVTLASILARFPASVGQKAMAASFPVVIASDQSAVPISGTVTTSPPANATTNVTQLNSTTVDTNSGAKSAGTLRVTLATDQVQLTNALKVDGSAVTQPVSGTVTTTPPSNASTNVTQFGNTNISTGTGTGGAGIPRVTVSSDSFPATQPVSGTVTANQGTPNTAANKWPISVTDGTSTAAVKAASTAAVATDPALVVALSPNNPISTTSANVGADGATTEPSVSLEGGWDGLNLRSAFVQTIDGRNTLATGDVQNRRLLEQVLLELQTLNTGLGLSAAITTNPLPAKPDPIINGAVRSVVGATTAQTLAFSAGNRSAIGIFNNSTSILYLLASAVGTVSSTFFSVILQSNDYWEAPQGPGGCYKGPITGIWVAANGTAQITEWTA